MNSKFDQLIEAYLRKQPIKKRRKKRKSNVHPPLPLGYKPQDTAMMPGRV